MKSENLDKLIDCVLLLGLMFTAVIIIIAAALNG